jgi:hypothetical protein
MGQQGLNFLIYSAEPGSPTEERLRLLASWGATPASQEVREIGQAADRDRRADDDARREGTAQ